MYRKLDPLCTNNGAPRYRYLPITVPCCSVFQPVCREMLPSVPPNFLGPYFYYPFVQNEEILVAICKIKLFFFNFLINVCCQTLRAVLCTAS